MTDSSYYGGIEGGGTKFVCMVGSAPDRIVDETRFATTTPAETLEKTLAFFEPYVHRGELASIGFASFGPVDLNADSPTFGSVMTTPKPGWAHSDMLGPIRKAFGLPIAFEVDVNAAAWGEYTWVPENGRCNPFVYFTIGTGIGAGVIVNGQLTHGLMHPEAGHVRVPHDWAADPYAGSCPYHGDCFEGLACGPAMNARWGQPAETLPLDHPAWDLQARYIALALTNVICTLSPMRIVLGGGVMQQPHLFPLVRQKVVQFLNGYIHNPLFDGDLAGYIVAPSLGGRSGVLGAIALARSCAGAA
ncbi:MAG: ROK family protein [Chloroflexota bacterium]